MGTIMAVAAVLEIHMDRNIVVDMNPNIRRRGLCPVNNVKLDFASKVELKFQIEDWILE